MKNMYMYSGPVYEFGNCVEQKWQASTWAESEQKARNNLAYRWKMDHGRTSNARITLPGTIKSV